MEPLHQKIKPIDSIVSNSVNLHILEAFVVCITELYGLLKHIAKMKNLFKCYLKMHGRLV
jgi:ADP-glucose pyrophosphorylase